MRPPVCVLAEAEPGNLDALSRALDRAGLAFEFRAPELISARDDPAIAVVVDPRAVVTGRVAAALAAAPTAPPLVVAAGEHERLPLSAALALGFADAIDACADVVALRERIERINRFGLRRRILRLQRRALEPYAVLERPTEETPRQSGPPTAPVRPHLLLAGPGGAARVALMQILTGWARATLSHAFDLSTDTTDLDLVVLTGPPRGDPAQLRPALSTGMPPRPAPVLGVPGAWADAADLLPAETAPELVRMRLRAWLAHRAAERWLRAAVDEWAHAAIVDPPSRLLGRAFLTDFLDAVLAGPGGAATAIVAIGLDGLEELNRRNGHAMGQRVLRLVGQAIAAMIRAEDLAGRVRGARFCVALPDSDEAAATRLAERLVTRLNGLRLPAPIDPRFRAATATLRVGQDAARLIATALDRLDLATAQRPAG